MGTSQDKFAVTRWTGATGAGTTFATASTLLNLDNAGNLTLGGTIASDTGKIQSIFTSGMILINKALSGLSNCALYQGGSGDTTINSATGFPIKFSINNTECMRITSDGYVGIGTTNPTVPLMINNNSATQYPSIAKFLAPNTTDGTSQVPSITLGISDTETASLSFVKYGTDYAQNSFAIGHSGVSQAQFVFTRSGYLCIGTTNPTAAYVAGYV